MFFRLLLLFTVVPIVELALLLRVGEVIGVFYTLFLIVITGVLGGILARWEGLRVVSDFARTMRSGKIPGDALLDAVLVMAGALFLITPGLITDALGFTLLLPTRKWFRVLVKKLLWRYLLAKGIKTSWR